jgi:hypothetical protein
MGEFDDVGAVGDDHADCCVGGAGSGRVVPWLTEQRRAWLYRLVTPVTVLLVAYGAVDEATAALWVGVVTAALTGGLAIRNTSTKPA